MGRGLNSVRDALVYEVDGVVKAYITVSFDGEGNLREVFVNVGKAGTTLNSMFQAVGRVISVGLRDNAGLVDKFIDTLKGVGGGEFYRCGELRGKSLPDMIAKVMEDAVRRRRGDVRGEVRVEEGNEKKGIEGGVERVERRKVGDLCPVCGELAVVRMGNCMHCENCGYSTC